MKKLILSSLASLSLISVNAQTAALEKAQYINNFNGSLYTGQFGATITPYIYDYSNIAMAVDPAGNSNSAIFVKPNSFLQLRGLTKNLTDTNWTFTFWYKFSGSTSTNVGHNAFFIMPNSSSGGYKEGTFIAKVDDNSVKFGNINYSKKEIKTKTQKVEGLDFNTWNHFTLTREGNVLTLYINNKYVEKVGEVGFDPYNSDNAVQLGGFSAGGYYSTCSGNFDNLRLYYSVLDSTQRAAIYRWESTQPSKTDFSTFYFGADKLKDGIIYDANNIYYAQTVNTVEFEASQHPDRKAIKLTGSGLRINHVNDFLIRNEGTVATWVRKRGGISPAPEYTSILYIPNNGKIIKEGQKYTPQFALTMNRDNEYGIFIKDSFYKANTKINVDDWNHLAFTFKNDQLKFYVNGKVDGTYTIDTFEARNSTGAQSITIAHHDFNGSKSNFYGSFDQIIFNGTAATDGQIADLAKPYEAPEPPASIGNNTIPNLKIYPNPTNDIIYFSLNVDIKVYDMLGRLLLEKNKVDYINISHLNNGSYTLELTHNGIKASQTIIKK